MSKLETNTIDTVSGTSTLQVGSTNTSTITLGVSGDTINVPSGVTINNNGTQTGFGGTNTPIVMVRPSSNQAISSSTETQVVFDTEQIDTASAFASNQFTVPSGQAGKYFIGATIIADTDTDNSLQRVNIRSNSTTIAYGNFRLSGTDDNTMSVQTIVDLSVGDVIKVIYFSYQNASSIRSHGEYNNGTQLYICKLIT